MQQISSSRAKLSTIPPQPGLSPLELVEKLELCGGNLKLFLTQYMGSEPSQMQSDLFQTESILRKDPVLWKRWNEVIHQGYEAQTKLLREKAFKTLADFYNPSDKSPSPEVAFCNLLIGNILNPKASIKTMPQELLTGSQEQDDILESFEKELENGSN